MDDRKCPCLRRLAPPFAVCMFFHRLFVRFVAKYKCIHIVCMLLNIGRDSFKLTTFLTMNLKTAPSINGEFLIAILRTKTATTTTTTTTVHIKVKKSRTTKLHSYTCTIKSKKKKSQVESAIVSCSASQHFVYFN